MATLTVQDVGGGNGNVTFAAASAGGDSVPVGIVNANFALDPVVLIVVNGGAVPIDVTVGGVVTNVLAGDTAVLPANRGVYPGQLMAITYEAVTSVTVAAIKI